MENPKVKRVLMSVTDKTGVVEFARALHDEFGAEIISTGGTARAIADGGVPVTPIDEVTKFPEMMSRPCTPWCTAAFWPSATTRSTWPRPTSTASR